MKVKILYLLLLFVACGQNTKSQNNLPAKDTIQTKTYFREFKDKTIFEGDTPNGKIKTIIQTFYGEYCDSSDVIYTFDEYGLQVRRQGLGPDIFIKYYKYNKVINTSIYFADNGKEYERNEYLYDERGNLIKHIHIYLPNEKRNYSDSTITQYFYNNENKLIEQREGRETIKYQYDENGDCVTKEEYGGKILNMKKEYKYINHKLIETFLWQRFEEIGYYMKNLYKYNADGSLESVTQYFIPEAKEFSKESDETTYYYTYDNKNRLIKFYKKNNYYEKTITYNDFDEKGNWQLKNTNNNGKQSKIKRRFEYFDTSE